MAVQTPVRTHRKQAVHRRGALFYVGVVLVLAGLGVLGYVAWQFYGTNIVSHQRQQQAVEDLRTLWAKDAQGSSRSQAGDGRVPLGEGEAIVRIPRFGRDYEVPVLRGVSGDALASGFGHFDDSADPGKKGNYALAGHRITHGEPLRRMPELRPGDKVIVETRDTVFTYVLDTNPNDLIVTFRDVWVVDPRPVNPDPDGVNPSKSKRLITLTTCSELFHTDNRMVAFGHLVGAEKR